jgi:ribosome modulation factor
MRIEINEQAWNRGFWDGESGEPSHACPHAVHADERLSWLSGYIEGKAFRTATSPPRPAPASYCEKTRLPLSRALFRFAPQLWAQRPNILAR